MLLLAVFSSPALASRPSARPGPSAAQIRAAIRAAKRSPSLWATVNICHSGRRSGKIGIRAQMPSLGFTTYLHMRFQVDYYSNKDAHFVPDPGVEKAVVLGRGQGTHELHQGGATFGIVPPAFLRGTVTFEWRLGGRVLGSAVRQTGYGYRNVDHAKPSGYSTATCTLT